MKTKHAPGPWTIEFPSLTAPLSDPAFIRGADNFSVCRISNGRSKRSQANAQLIVAAPDLLAACERAAEEFREFFPTVCGEALTQLEDAIAKAKGE